MGFIQRFLLGNRVEDDLQVGLFLKNDGTVWLRNPDRSETQLPGGGGSGGGVWKTFGLDSSNQPLTGISVGDGTLVGRWWTPAAVVADPATDPFLCIIDIVFLLGASSTVDGGLRTTGPKGVDGTTNDLVPDVPAGAFPLVPVIVVATVEGNSHLGFQDQWGESIFAAADLDNTLAWGPTYPEAGGWATADVIRATATFMASFAAED